MISIKSPKGTYDSALLANYTTININDALARIQGVGQINLFGGSDYAMRVWLRPDRIGRLGLTVPDIANAISQQSQLSPAGQIGGPPAASAPAAAPAAPEPERPAGRGEAGGDGGSHARSPTVRRKGVPGLPLRLHLADRPDAPAEDRVSSVDDGHGGRLLADPR